MKKRYITPVADIAEIRTVQMLNASGVSDEEKGIGYGGIDEEGELEPAARRRDVWEDDEEDDDEQL